MLFLNLMDAFSWASFLRDIFNMILFVDNSIQKKKLS